jgi:hypothetical protein
LLATTLGKGERHFSRGGLENRVQAIRTLVLIPESTRKAKGGGPLAAGSAVLEDALPRDARRRLEFLRRQIREASPEATGDSAELLPAYQRFRGNMYRAIPDEAWAERIPGVEIVMVSGLYGLVASRDPVVAYEVSMAEPLERLGKLNRWWRDHGLPGLLRTYLDSVHPAQVLDILSLEYREAVDGYASGLQGTKVRTIDFRGLGRGSQPRRGKLVAKLLRGEPLAEGKDE